MNTHSLVKEALLQLDIEVSDENKNLFDLGLDSLSLVRLVMTLEKKFTLRLATKDFDRRHFSTLRNIQDHIESLKKGG